MEIKGIYEGPWGSSEDLIELNTGEWRFQRPVTNSSKCRQCGLCLLHCSTNCIEERRGYFSADLKYCKGCGLCAQMCPAKAISIVREEV